MTETEVQTIKSVQITCDVIEALKEMNTAGVTELATRLDHSKSTIHDHLATLKENGLVVKDESKYRLSIQFLDIANQVRDQFPNYEIIKDELRSLAEETGEVAQFGIEEHGRVRFLYKTTGNRGVETASSIGTEEPMHSTALGKAILAHLPKQRVHEILDWRGMAAQTEQTITDRDALFEELEEVRRRGYAVDDQENVKGLRCIAAPVLEDEVAFGALSVSGPSTRFNGEKFHDEIPDKVKSSANVIELNSKFS